ncbi:hypothetical protein GCM10020358_15470 [Amorphoplanes nipponensis]|uniref:DUF998 domain-containing protein n=1 Tax=Actinoplanes nipponensis TaxID=135950 RepID=A0A919JQ76_9ACTN|nr:DUF998 domain-containing protein [Actinoplanes nipponensis]GIE53311.1 hypothetical protein Ani05nite_68450 [Actinoplanes nipponensis]
MVPLAHRPDRLAAWAGAAVLTGALTMLAGLVAAPGPWTQGYVSEAGTAGMPLAAAYRWGLLGLAVGVGLLGGVLRRSSRPVATLLGLAALLAATSGVVPCTAGCPLPPYEQTTVADVTHTAASVIGMVLLAGAMALIALSAPFGAVLRRLAAVAVAVIVPLGATLGLTMLLAGRGPAGATLERVALVVAVSWLIGTAVVLARPGAAGRDPVAGPAPTLRRPGAR